jgi:membrane dipeptidase
MPRHLNRRLLLTTLALTSLMPLLAHAQTAPVTDQVRAIHAKTLVIDPHVDIPFDYGSGALDPKSDGSSQFDLPKAKRGGVGAVAIAAFVPQGSLTPEGYADAKAKLATKLAAIKAIAANNPDQVEIALSPADVERIHGKGKLAEIISFLNAYPLGEDLSGIDDLYKDGVRVFGFVHAGSNAFADSSRPSATDKVRGGLTPLGLRAVAKLNDLGVLIDISQLTRDGALQAIKASRAPVIATHSGLKSVVANPRNLSDEELLALKAKGGVIAIVAFKPYLKGVPADKLPEVAALRAQYGLSATYAFPQEGSEALESSKRTDFSHAVTDLIPPATVADLIDSVDRAVKLIGIDHVAISSDFNHGGGVVGWSNEGEAINVTAELVKRGYSPAGIGKLWGGNTLRVWKAAQAARKN